MGSAAGLDLAVRKCIDDHLDAIDGVLRERGLPRAERQGILADVQTQILEMLSARAKGAPTLRDAEAIIAELDPPESYAREAEGGASQSLPAGHPALRVNRSLEAVFGYVLLILGAILPFLWLDATGLIPGAPMFLTGIGLLIRAYRPRGLKAYLLALAALLLLGALVGSCIVKWEAGNAEPVTVHSPPPPAATVTPPRPDAEASHRADNPEKGPGPFYQEISQ